MRACALQLQVPECRLGREHQMANHHNIIEIVGEQ
jgi:hypothetical protein